MFFNIRSLLLRSDGVLRDLLGLFLARLDLGHETIATTGHRDDELIRARRLAQNTPERRDILREVVFLDDHVRPDGVH